MNLLVLGCELVSLTSTPAGVHLYGNRPGNYPQCTEGGLFLETLFTFKMDHFQKVEGGSTAHNILQLELLPIIKYVTYNES